MEDELIQEFIIESREHLATIETDLLAIEEAGTNAGDQLLNKVFRAAHSIKGAAGFFDLRNVKDLAHKAETVLEMLRSRKITANAEITNVLLRAFDRLRELINSYDSSNEADITTEAQSLQELASSYTQPQAKSALVTEFAIPVSGSEVIAISAFDLERLVNAGQRIFSIHLDLIHDIERQGRQVLRFFRELSDFGEIVDCRLAFEEVGTLDGPISNSVPLEIIYGTSLAGEDICSLFGVPKVRVAAIEVDALVASTEQKRSPEPPIAQVTSDEPASALPSVEVASPVRESASSATMGGASV